MVKNKNLITNFDNAKLIQLFLEEIKDRHKLTQLILNFNF